MKVIIVGGMQPVYFLCRLFHAKGYRVTVINRDKDACTWLARHLKATVIHGDGSDLQILEEAGASTVDAIIAITPNDQDNLVICQLGHIHFRIPRTLAMVNDPDNEEVFGKLGVSAVSVTRILSKLIEHRAGFEEVINLFPIGEGKINVTEIVLKSSSPVVGKSLREIGMPDGSLIASILRNDEPIIPRGGTMLQDKDRIVIITFPENHGEVLRILTGDRV
ncbi:MAG: NAD-binding protein [bacterium]